MKATGIIRRVDDLGRVVIPKEIRRSLRIREGEPLEIYIMDRNTVCFRKYEITLSGEIDLLESLVYEYLESWEIKAKIQKLFKEVKELVKSEE